MGGWVSGWSFDVGEHGLTPGLAAGVGGIEGFVAEGIDFCV